MKKIYRVLGYINGYNKKASKWESIFHTETIYIGKEGLKTAHQDYENELSNFKFNYTQHDSKYREVRGKIELHEPYFYPNGSMAYYGIKNHQSFNPDNL